MFLYSNKSNFQLKTRLIALLTVVCLSLPPQGYTSTLLNLPAPGTMVPLSPDFAPVLLKGIKINLQNPLQFDFLIDRGVTNLRASELKGEATRLIKYFLAGLTIPEDELWVNLSPYEKERVIPREFGYTEMGRDLLAQDYMLKQITASLMYPENDFGKKFWQRVYKKASRLYSSTDIPVNTFNKVWIIPEKAAVHTNGTIAYVIGSHLRVLLEEDYLALQSNLGNEKFGVNQIHATKAERINKVSSAIVKEVVVPELEKEVNTGKNFTQLRQIYHAMILATWFKKNLRESLLGKVYIEQNKVDGVDIPDKQMKEKIYQQYLEAFKKGVYDYIREDIDPVTQQLIPRKYFSGGTRIAIEQARLVEENSSDSAQLAREAMGDDLIVSAVINPLEREDSAMLGQEKKVMVEVPIDVGGRKENLEFQVGASLKDVFSPEGPGSLESVIAEALEQLPTPSADQEIRFLRYRIPLLSREEYVHLGYEANIDITTEYSMDFWQNLPKDLLKKMFIVEIWKSIRKKRISVKSKVDLRKTETEPRDTLQTAKYYRKQISKDAFVELLKQAARVQERFDDDIMEVMIPRGESSLQEILYSGKEQEKFILLDERRVGDLLEFLKNSKGLDLYSEYIIRSVIDFNQRITGQTPEAEKTSELSRLHERKLAFDNLLKQYNELEGRRGFARPRLLELLKEMSDLDPYSFELKQKRIHLKNTIAQQEFDIYKGNKLAEKFKARTENAEDVLAEIIKQPHSTNKYYLIALFQILLAKRDLDLSRINLILSFIPRLNTLKYAEASAIARRVTGVYREKLIEEILPKNIDGRLKDKLRILYRMEFLSSSKKRRQRIEKSDFDIMPGILNKMEANFKKLKKELQNLNISFMYAVYRREEIDLKEFYRNSEKGRDHDSFAAMLKKNIGEGEYWAKTKEYFAAVYGLDVDLVLDKDRIPGLLGPGKTAELFTRGELAEVLERLVIVDRVLSRLPRNLILNSLALQKIFLFKEKPAFYQHSEDFQESVIALPLEEESLLTFLLHELGHSWHGPRGNFAAYVDPGKIIEFLEEHDEYFAEEYLTKRGEVTRRKAKEINNDPGGFVWELFTFVFKKGLERWETHNRRLGINDLNDPANHAKINVRTEKAEESFSSINIKKRGYLKVFDPAYIYEKDLRDLKKGEPLLRDVPVEMVAQYTEGLMGFFDQLRAFDFVGVELLNMMVGDIAVPKEEDLWDLSGIDFQTIRKILKERETESSLLPQTSGKDSKGDGAMLAELEHRYFVYPEYEISDKRDTLIQRRPELALDGMPMESRRSFALLGLDDKGGYLTGWMNRLLDLMREGEIDPDFKITVFEVDESRVLIARNKLKQLTERLPDVERHVDFKTNGFADISSSNFDLIAPYSSVMKKDVAEEMFRLVKEGLQPYGRYVVNNANFNIVYEMDMSGAAVPVRLILNLDSNESVQHMGNMLFDYVTDAGNIWNVRLKLVAEQLRGVLGQIVAGADNRNVRQLRSGIEEGIKEKFAPYQHLKDKISYQKEAGYISLPLGFEDNEKAVLTHLRMGYQTAFLARPFSNLELANRMQTYYPGPVSNWPVSVNDILQRLKQDGLLAEVKKEKGVEVTYYSLLIEERLKSFLAENFLETDTLKDRTFTLQSLAQKLRLRGVGNINLEVLSHELEALVIKQVLFKDGENYIYGLKGSDYVDGKTTTETGWQDRSSYKESKILSFAGSWESALKTFRQYLNSQGLSMPRDGIVLDLGIGESVGEIVHLLDSLKPKQVWGVDWVGVNVYRAADGLKRRSISPRKVRLSQQNMEELSGIPDQSVDIVFGHAIIFGDTKFDALAQQLSRVLKPGALAYIGGVMETDYGQAEEERRREFLSALNTYFNGKVIDTGGGVMLVKAKTPEGAVLSKEGSAAVRGGIDLNPDALDLVTTGDKINLEMPFDPAQPGNMNIEGFTPVIINISPVTNIPLLLGLEEPRVETELSSL